ncbi:putative non-syndromic hearing impairment protein 5-like [Scophthalmus maximus]|uniref:Gasdermin Eb n=1 Tax=Scophthalmus maximus TaxID=52904 RepID=A0A2U9AYF5_SCOMX|nr:gasdermin Eb [Scophthalmus maximus]XP_035485721.1 gasdermin Eb [Scophthalmus maximus]AWO96723.1 putative non-syndromic hearing impairment protein 5-like [Scophthalmus maximus]
MFATATRNFVEEVDAGGLLIPVSSLNDTIALLTVVVKRRRFWCWQKPKYIPTDFDLNDILTGDSPLQPVAIESDFIKYNGTYGDNIQGAMDANFVRSGVSMQAKDSSKLQSSFGSLKKEEANVQKLLQESKNRVLDMSHCLIHQTKEKHRRILGIVKERIVTAMPCSVIEEVQQGGQCGAGLSLLGIRGSKVSLKENGSLSKDSNVTMEIPTHTTIAYALIELEIKLDGCYELCLTSDTNGGFEVDSSAKKGLLCVSGAPPHASENSRLRQDLEQLDDHFQLLSSLPDTTRSSLFQQFTKVMQDQAAVTALQDALDQICLENSPDLGDNTTTESQKQNIQEILDLVEQCGQVGSAQTGQSVLTALHLISSALDEMTSDRLAVFAMCCSHEVLQTMELLVQCVSGKGELLLSSADLTALTRVVFERTAHLFASSNVSLKRDGDTLRTEINQAPGNLPLVLCIAVRGLASLTVCV